MIRKVLFAVGLLLGLPFASQAAPIACVSGSLADYIGLSEGCFLGTALVTDFVTTPTLPGTTAIDPADVTVAPVLGRIAFDFGLSQSALPGDLFSVAFRYLPRRAPAEREPALPHRRKRRG